MSPVKVNSSPPAMEMVTAENCFLFGGFGRTSSRPHRTGVSDRVFASTTVQATPRLDCRDLSPIPPAEFSNYPYPEFPPVKHYVYLEAKFPNQQVLEKVVLVSFQSGFIFIQTDNTLYTPKSRVYYRLFGVTPRMEPLDSSSNARTDNTVSIQIVVHFWTVPTNFPDLIFLNFLVCLCSPGLWKIFASFMNDPEKRFSANFEVKDTGKIVLHYNFEVKLSSRSPFFHVDGQSLEIHIKATWVNLCAFGQVVNGMAYVVFGVMDNGQQKSLNHSLSRVPIEHGTGKAELKRDHITKAFHDIRQSVPQVEKHYQDWAGYG
uniref:Macroglobulin domain-containing protein n=1 Tax=Oryzias latipes TaxID=8090 RepID=A0A3B3I399_ORYLA